MPEVHDSVSAWGNRSTVRWAEKGVGMKYRPAHFMHRPDVAALRKELAATCSKALLIAKKRSNVQGESFTYDFTSEEYIRLMYRRENILRQIRKIWND